MKKLLISCAMMLAGVSTIMAVPAMPGMLKTVTQPDGTTIKVRVIGDEHSHCYLTEDRVPLVVDSKGNFCYATLDTDGKVIASDFKASDIALRSAAERKLVASIDPAAVADKILSRGEARRNARRVANPAQGTGLTDALFPHMGDVHSLIILVEYTDVKFKVSDPADYFNRMLNEKGFSDDHGKGSARDYFVDMSSGQFSPTFDVYGPVTLPYNRAYYGGNDAFGNDKAAEDMVVHACKDLNKKGLINFADYDLNNDGKVDNIYVIYAGQGEASYGSADCVWPHQWELSTIGKSFELDGKTIDHYGCCNEYDEIRPSGIGTFCHEFGHVMGLPDLYTTDYSGAMTMTPGSYDIMDHGSYNDDSRTPAGYSVYERNAMGWADLTVLDGPNTITLEHILDNNKGCIICTENRNEFFLLENRQQTGWDAFIPGHGMLIWHIDFNAGVWSKNTVNNDPKHQYIDIEEASGRPNNDNAAFMAAYTFPGTSRVTSFTDDTTPSMRSWGGKALNLPITGIVEKDGKVTFDVAGGVFELASPALTASAINAGGFTLSWPAVEKALAYTLNIYSKAADGTPVYACKDVEVDGTSFVVNRLDAEKTYYVTAVAHTATIFSEPSQEIEVTTGAFDFTLAVPRVESAPEMTNNGFSATWMPVKGASDYLLNVSGVFEVEPYAETADFGKGTKISLPEGWTSSTNQYYASKNYYGKAAPSLKMMKNGDTFSTRIFPDDITSFSFWARYTGTMNENYLEVEGRADEDSPWQLIKTVSSVPSTAAGLDVAIKNIPAGIHQIRVTYFMLTTGNMAVDDCTVTTGGTATEPLPGYIDLATGNVTSYDVTYTPSARGAGIPVSYVYTVKAKNTEGAVSLESDPVEVLRSARADDIVSDFVTDSEQPAAIYDLRGVRVEGTPAAGIYLRRTGSKVEKIVIR